MSTSCVMKSGFRCFANMNTFTVVKPTHPTLTRSVRSTVVKWKFVPAEVAGCKVPRNFNWAAVAGGDSKPSLR